MDGESKPLGGANDQVLSSLGHVIPRFTFESLKLDDLKSNFLSLRKLYGLLPNSADVTTENLDEKAQKLLKELLDAALERTSMDYLKLIATRSDICKPFSFNQLVQATAASESSRNIMGFHEGLGSQTPSLKKDEGLLSQKAPSEFDLQSVTKSFNSKKRCLACQHNRMEQQILARKDILAPQSLQKGWVQSKELQLSHRDAKYATEKNLNQSALIKSKHTTSAATRLSKLQGRFEYDFPTKIKEQPEKSDQFARDVDNAIKRTEAYISSVQLLSQQADPLRNSASQNGLYKLGGSAASVIQPKQQAKLKRDAGQVGESITGELALWQVSKKNHLSEDSSRIYEMPSCSLKTMGLQEAPFMKNSNIGNHIVSSGDNSTEVLSSVNNNRRVSGATTPYHGLSRLKRTHPVNSLMATANKPEPLIPLTNRDYVASHAGNMVHGLRVPPITEHSKGTPRKVEKPLTAITARHGDLISSIYSGHKDRRQSTARHNMIRRPAVMDQWLLNKKVPLHNRNQGRRRTSRPMHVEHDKEMLSSETESEYNSSSPYTSYSSWSSEGSRTRSSYSKASSSTYRNYSEESISSEPESSFEESLSSYSTSSYRQSGSSKKVGRIRKPASQHKEIGRFRRMKNKLGLIFHHHHHHHHHHHGPFNKNHTAVTRHGTSMWKHVQNIFHHKKESKKNKGRVVDKQRKSGNTNGKNFHKLVHGFLRHVRRTKKAKPIKRNGFKTQNKRKLHWWQMLRRNGGIKLPNKGKVRLKQPNRRLRLRAS